MNFNATIRQLQQSQQTAQLMGAMAAAGGATPAGGELAAGAVLCVAGVVLPACRWQRCMPRCPVTYVRLACTLLWRSVVTSQSCRWLHCCCALSRRCRHAWRLLLASQPCMWAHVSRRLHRLRAGEGGADGTSSDAQREAKGEQGEGGEEGAAARVGDDDAAAVAASLQQQQQQQQHLLQVRCCAPARPPSGLETTPAVDPDASLLIPPCHNMPVLCSRPRDWIHHTHAVRNVFGLEALRAPAYSHASRGCGSIYIPPVETMSQPCRRRP